MIDAGKRNVLGVLVDVVDYEAAAERVLTRRPGTPAAGGHRAGRARGDDRRADPAHDARLNAFDVVTPDGQPVRWALNLLHRAGLRDRVYGPTLTLRVLRALRRRRAAGLPVRLDRETLDRLTRSLTERFPALKIAGAEPSKFRRPDAGEEAQIAARIRDSGARVVLVGLGCPRQEIFAYAMRPLLDVPVLAVGAAFDYHAGQLRQPPAWMQRRGLEWLWRLGLEPRRLWRRYLLLNPAYLARLFAQKVGLWRAAPPAPAADPPATVPV